MFKISLLFCLLGISQMAQAMTDAKLLQQHLSRIRTLEAQFKQKVLTAQQRVKEEISGQFFLQKPNRFLWKIQQPSTQVLVSNGKVLWVYQKKLKQAVKMPITDQTQKRPIEFLSSSERQISYYFHVKSVQKGKQLTFYLEPKNKKMAIQEMQIGFQKHQLRRLAFKDALGQSVHIEFFDVRENIPLSPRLFQFVPPKGVDVIQSQQR